MDYGTEIQNVKFQFWAHSFMQSSTCRPCVSYPSKELDHMRSAKMSSLPFSRLSPDVLSGLLKLPLSILILLGVFPCLCINLNFLVRYKDNTWEGKSVCPYCFQQYLQVCRASSWKLNTEFNWITENWRAK